MPEAGSTKIGYSPTFLKQLHRLPVSHRNRFLIRETWFRADPFDARLRTHALTGRLSGAWAFSVTDSIRVLFTFQSKRTVVFNRIGTHDISYR